jgi:hypothetical protein
MSTGSISAFGSQNASQANRQSIRQQPQQAFQAVGQALQSGDLAGAQQAFAALQKDAPKSGGAQGNGQGPNSTNPTATDFQNLSQALQSGDLSAAQAAYAKLQTDQQAARSGGRHHHHHHDGGGGGPPTTTGSTLNTEA